MRLVSYARASTDRQVAVGMGLEVQEQAIRRWAKLTGHRVVASLRDEGVSGTFGVEEREALAETISLVRQGRADGVVVASLDRLARRLTVQEAVLAHVWDAGGRVFTIDEGGEIAEDDPDDPMRTAIRQMRGVFAQLDRSTINKRLRDGRWAKALAGGYAFGAPPLGYKAHQRTLVPEEAEQSTLHRIEALRASGASLRAIADALESEGHRTKRGGVRWHPHTIARICRRIEAAASAA